MSPRGATFGLALFRLLIHPIVLLLLYLLAEAWRQLSHLKGA